jgi:Mn-dependent DtxR family transcriptional regulator
MAEKYQVSLRVHDVLMTLNREVNPKEFRLAIAKTLKVREAAAKSIFVDLLQLGFIKEKNDHVLVTDAGRKYR